MKKYIITILLPFWSWMALGADVVTLTGNTVYTLSSNQVAEVITVSDHTGHSPSFRVNGNTVSTTSQVGSGATSLISQLPMIIAGPATLQKNTGSGWTGFMTIRVRSKDEYLASLNPSTPITSTAVVIPEDTSGPVTIVLESSTDLVNWTSANPGTFGSSTARRFFRVRAINN